MGDVIIVVTDRSDVAAVLAEAARRLERAAARLPREGPRLDEATFAAGVKAALRALDRPDLLAGNPLLDARLVRSACAAPADPRARAATLVAIVRREADALFASERDAVYRRVLEHTCFSPAAKQTAAADDLGLAFGTYRRHLRTAVERLTAALWVRENTE